MFASLLLLAINQQPKFVRVDDILNYAGTISQAASGVLHNLDNASDQNFINQNKPNLSHTLNQFRETSEKLKTYQKDRCKFDRVYYTYFPLEITPDVEKTLSELAILGERMTANAIQINDLLVKDHAAVASQLFGNNRAGKAASNNFLNEFAKYSNNRIAEMNFVNETSVLEGKSVKVQIEKGCFNLELLHYAVPFNQERVFLQHISSEQNADNVKLTGLGVGRGEGPHGKKTIMPVAFTLKPRATVEVPSYVKSVTFDLPYSNSNTAFCSYLVLKAHDNYKQSSQTTMLMPVDGCSGNAPFWSPVRAQTAFYKVPIKNKKVIQDVSLEAKAVPDTTGMLSNFVLEMKK